MATFYGHLSVLINGFWLYFNRISPKPIQIIVFLYIVLKKMMTNTPSHENWVDIVIGNHALHVQPIDKSVIC